MTKRTRPVQFTNYAVDTLAWPTDSELLAYLHRTADDEAPDLTECRWRGRLGLPDRRSVDGQ